MKNSDLFLFNQGTFSEEKKQQPVHNVYRQPSRTNNQHTPYELQDSSYGRQYNRYGSHQSSSQRQSQVRVYHSQNQGYNHCHNPQNSRVSHHNPSFSRNDDGSYFESQQLNGLRVNTHSDFYSKNNFQTYNPFKENDQQPTNRNSRPSYHINSRNVTPGRTYRVENRRMSHMPSTQINQYAKSRSPITHDRRRSVSPIQQQYGVRHVRIEPEVIEVKASSKKIDANTLEIEIDQTINLNKIEDFSVTSPLSPTSDKTVQKSPINSRLFHSNAREFQFVNTIDLDTPNQPQKPLQLNSRQRSASPISTPNRYISSKKLDPVERNRLNRTPSTVQKITVEGSLQHHATPSHSVKRYMKASPSMSRIASQQRETFGEYFKGQSPMTRNVTRVVTPIRNTSSNKECLHCNCGNNGKSPSRVVTTTYTVDQSRAPSPSGTRVRDLRSTYYTQSSSNLIPDYSRVSSPKSTIRYSNYYASGNVKVHREQRPTLVYEHAPRVVSTKVFRQSHCCSYNTHSCCHSHHCGQNYHPSETRITKIEHPPRTLSATIQGSPIVTRVQVQERASPIVPKPPKKPVVQVKEEKKEEELNLVVVRENKDHVNRITDPEFLDKMNRYVKPLKPNLGEFRSPRGNKQIKFANKPIKMPNSLRIRPKIKKSRPATTKPEPTYYPDHPDDRSSILLYIIDRRADSDMEVEQEHEIDHFFVDKQNQEHKITTTIVSKSKKQLGHLMVSPPHVKIILDGEFVSESTPIVNEELKDEDGNEIFYDSESANLNSQGIKVHRVQDKKSKFKRDSRLSFATDINNVTIDDQTANNQERHQSVGPERGNRLMT